MLMLHTQPRFVFELIYLLPDAGQLSLHTLQILQLIQPNHHHILSSSLLMLPSELHHMLHSFLPPFVRDIDMPNHLQMFIPLLKIVPH